MKFSKSNITNLKVFNNKKISRVRKLYIENYIILIILSILLSNSQSLYVERCAVFIDLKPRIMSKLPILFKLI